ncbi:MAG TPA: hypothetical protein VN677_03130 [Gemmatimonadaceae bacterium]|nr:hypothetical protein [Gemmatimonadaceae bacterium]
MKRLLALATALTITACSRPLHQQSALPPLGNWEQTLTAAQLAAGQSRFDDADYILTAFSQRHPNAPESREVNFWRALFRLDPANTHASTSLARENLQAYLSDSSLVLHRTEAIILRSVAGAMDSLQRRADSTAHAADAAKIDAAAASVAQNADLQKENQRLKDELDKRTAELERIKKRLSERKP